MDSRRTRNKTCIAASSASEYQPSLPLAAGNSRERLGCRGPSPGHDRAKSRWRAIVLPAPLLRTDLHFWWQWPRAFAMNEMLSPFSAANGLSLLLSQACRIIDISLELDPAN